MSYSDAICAADFDVDVEDDGFDDARCLACGAGADEHCYEWCDCDDCRGEGE